jgi:hypothetical protein
MDSHLMENIRNSIGKSVQTITLYYLKGTRKAPPKPKKKSNHANAYASPSWEQAGIQYQILPPTVSQKKLTKLTQAYLVGKALPAWSLPANPSRRIYSSAVRKRI